MSLTLNPCQRVANSALKYSRQITLCRRAYHRTRANRDKRFWYVWEESLQEKMIACANMIIRLQSINNFTMPVIPSRLSDE